jgi:hypothetical protein
MTSVMLLEALTRLTLNQLGAHALLEARLEV